MSRWDACQVLRERFVTAFPNEQENCIRAWVLIFFALNDLGKADIRFQLKTPDALAGALQALTPFHATSISSVFPLYRLDTETDSLS